MKAATWGGVKSIAQIAKELERLEAKYDHNTRAGRVPHTDPAQEEDSAYRRRYGKNGRAPYGRPLRAAYYQHLPPAPRGKHLTREDAAIYVAKIQRVIDMECWTRREKEVLRVLKARWGKRARGEDPRYAAMGNAPGVNNRFRKKTLADDIAAMRELIRESKTKTKGGRATTKFVSDPKWPLGRFNPDRRA